MESRPKYGNIVIPCNSKSKPFFPLLCHSSPPRGHGQCRVRTPHSESPGSGDNTMVTSPPMPTLISPVLGESASTYQPQRFQQQSLGRNGSRPNMREGLAWRDGMITFSLSIKNELIAKEWKIVFTFDLKMSNHKFVWIIPNASLYNCSSIFCHFTKTN